MKTIRYYPFEAGRTLYPIDFELGILSRNHVYVYVGEDFKVQVGYSWVSNGQISLDSPIQPDEELKIRRIVPKSELFNDYEDGARLNERNLDDSFKQPLMILEELADGLISEVEPWVINTLTQFQNGAIFKDNLDMDGNRIVNLGWGISSNDAVTVAQAGEIAKNSAYKSCVYISGDLGFVDGPVVRTVDEGCISDLTICSQDLGSFGEIPIIKNTDFEFDYTDIVDNNLLLNFVYTLGNNELQLFVNGSWYKKAIVEVDGNNISFTNEALDIISPDSELTIRRSFIDFI